VFINGTRVATEQELQHSDKISVGPLEFFVHLSVTVNGQKKPKVASVSDAVSRTVEMQSSSTTGQEGGESEIADWLSSSSGVDADQETKTIDVDNMLESLQDHKNAVTESTTPPENDKSDKPETSRDVAANLLKNFFKGGR
jgi:predicted component of type VI protein secretion system